MNDVEKAALAQEQKTNASTIRGLQRRIQLSQEEIDLLTTRNEAIDALLAPPQPEVVAGLTEPGPSAAP